MAFVVTVWVEGGEADVEVDVVILEVVVVKDIVEDVEALQEPKADWHPVPQ